MTDTVSLRTPKRRRIFLETLAETAIVAEACRRAGGARGSFYRWRAEDPAFAADWDRARAIGLDSLEDEAIRRARDGIERPVFRDGKQVGVMRRYSDRLLEFLLRAHDPERYCPRARAAAVAAKVAAEMSQRPRFNPGPVWARPRSSPPPGSGPRLPDGRPICDLTLDELKAAYTEHTGKPPPPPKPP